MTADLDGQPRRLPVADGADIIDLRGGRAETATTTEVLLAAILASAVDAVIILDADGFIETINPAAERLLGYDSDELLGQNVNVLLSGPRPLALEEGSRPHLDGRALGVVGACREVSLRRRDGSRAAVEISVSEVQAEGRHLFVGIGRNIGARKEAERDLRRRATIDQLTGLVNRGSLHRALAQAMLRVDDGRQLALLFIDLDDFKGVNDTHGHSIGDRVLSIAAARLNTAVRRPDLVGRYGGDEFVVVIETSGEVRSQTGAVTDRIRAAFESPFTIEGDRYPIGISIGVAIHPDDGVSISQLIDHADRAMYAEKAGKRTRS